ncbi:2130_t:CDS:1, partial [Dentiscutata erythropus]
MTQSMDVQCYDGPSENFYAVNFATLHMCDTNAHHYSHDINTAVP